MHSSCAAPRPSTQPVVCGTQASKQPKLFNQVVTVEALAEQCGAEAMQRAVGQAASPTSGGGGGETLMSV
jgi:hypothetical protein